MFSTRLKTPFHWRSCWRRKSTDCASGRRNVRSLRTEHHYSSRLISSSRRLLLRDYIVETTANVTARGRLDAQRRIDFTRGPQFSGRLLLPEIPIGPRTAFDFEVTI